MKKKIVIQGAQGAFHEIAAFYYYKDEEIEIVPANTFKDLFKCLKKNEADAGIMAIENSIAGSILPNYAMLQNSGLEIEGEIYLRIKQNLAALPGQKIKDIKEVYSHPMAIMQCEKFFNEHPNIKLIDSVDTALSAKEIGEKKLYGIAAISSSQAAKKYGLEILADSIETNKMNYTRFLIISGKKENREIVNKSAITFALEHRIGSLSKILSIFSFYDINLTKIQSMPIIGKDWEYQFYVDVVFDDYKIYKNSLVAIKPFTSSLIILGEYIKGNTIIE
ncbi:MAG: prephenate dehydratase [Bacteroidales bacterium]|nr:prephenate dehydratase [Bacteroidales bacterium]